MNTDILNSILAANSNGEKAALVAVNEAGGSSPAKAGAMMCVFYDGTATGTVGGGKLEHVLTQQALQALKDDKSCNFSYRLDDPLLCMTCGGYVQGSITVFLPRKKLVIAGAGHVSQKVANVASTLDFDIYVVDDRAEFKDRFSGVKEYFACDVEGLEGKITIDESTFVVIATRGHEQDFRAAKFFSSYRCKYLGMIGSKKKVMEVKEKLINAGVCKDIINSIYAPIGLDISNGSPEEIAISILAEILSVKNGLNAHHRYIEI